MKTVRVLRGKEKPSFNDGTQQDEYGSPLLPPMLPGRGTDSGYIIHGIAYPDKISDRYKFCPYCGHKL